MQVCILIAGRDKDGGRLNALAKGFAKGLESQGHMADIVNVSSEQRRLTIYDYLIVGSEPVSFFSASIPQNLKKYLESAGQVTGKRALAFIPSCLRKGRTMQNLMRIMESEGIILKLSEVVNKPDEAIAIGKRLRIERNI